MSSKILSQWALRLCTEYEGFHLDSRNRLTHAVGIPLIAVGMLALLGTFAPWVAVAFAASYWMLDWRIAIPFTLLVTGLFWLSQSIPVPLGSLCVILGWALQAHGHWAYEKNRPAFLSHLKHLWIGPFCLFARWIGVGRGGSGGGALGA